MSNTQGNPWCAQRTLRIDTTPVILAVASPPGASLRGIVRASGPGCFDLIETHLQPLIRARRAQQSRLRLDHLDLPCLAILFPGPRSYTGEDCAEVQLPGNPLLLERVIDGLLRSAAARGVPARRAAPGEFTARAFLNGRISLTRAEGVAATIAAHSDAQLRAAQFLREGAVAALAQRLAGALADLLARVEAGIDFSDQEDVTSIDPAEVARRLDALAECIAAQLASAAGTERPDALPWVMLTGPTNAGKSTLFNALLGRTRAVVSDVPGTTRDVLTERLFLDTPAGPAEVILVDAAGADPGDAPMNARMQDAARRAAQRSELRLRCVPADAPDPLDSPASGDLLVRTKSDLAPLPRHGLAVSARSGAGLPDLRRIIAARLAHRAGSPAAEAAALLPRHLAALRQALDAIDDARRQSAHGPRAQPELLAAGLRLALNHVAELAGDIAPDDLLDRIFATFCVGK